jgi:hypothetical protein
VRRAGGLIAAVRQQQHQCRLLLGMLQEPQSGPHPQLAQARLAVLRSVAGAAAAARGCAFERYVAGAGEVGVAAAAASPQAA